jgi:hypothetical protein
MPNTLSKPGRYAVASDAHASIIQATPTVASRRPQTPIASPSPEPELTSRLRWVNESLLDTLTDEAAGSQIAFFCECEIPGCYGPVWLTKDQFRARIANDDEIRLDQHLR